MLSVTNELPIRLKYTMEPVINILDKWCVKKPFNFNVKQIPEARQTMPQTKFGRLPI
jgi:hypothetical protein